jgi:protein-L-isoaspartate(D-aspartate) O-methyltransferase
MIGIEGRGTMPSEGARRWWVGLLALLGVGCRSTADGDVVVPDATGVASAEPLAEGADEGIRDPEEARSARRRLVSMIRAEQPWAGSGGWDPRVLDALEEVPRHLFMPGAQIRTAYRDEPAPIGHGQTISQPTVVAIMSDALELQGTERVLEIGTGSGYQAAVLSRLAAHVYSIEIVEPLGLAAKERLARLGYQNVEVRIGDGYAGWPEHAPFDRILLTAAPPEIPDALVAQLREGGLLVAPVGEGADQRLVRWTKTGGVLKKEDLGAVRFVPMVPGD